MSWQLLASVTSSSEWFLTEPMSGNLFRITHSTNSNSPSDLRAIVAQAFDEDGSTTYFDARRLAYKLEQEAFLFKQPGGLLNRKLAVKRLDSLAAEWTIKIEVLDGMPESISLPIEISEVSGLLEQLEARVTQLEFTTHTVDTDNPHLVTAQQIGAEPIGTGITAATTAIASHLNQVDPHAQYATDTEVAALTTTVNALQSALDSKENIGVASNLITNLIAIQIPQIIPTATIIDYEGTIAANGILNVNGLIWLLLDGATIGDINSGATRYADSKAQTLYQRLWDNPNLNVFSASGVITIKGSSAIADFNSLKRLALPDLRGRTIIPAGTGTGLTAKTRGQTGGSETHIIQVNEIPSHNHSRGNINQQDLWGYNPTNLSAKVTLSDVGNLAFSATQLNDTGGGQSHNNMQPYYVTSGKLILVGKA